MKFKKIRNLVKKLVQQMLGNEPFQFTIPKNFKQNFLGERFTDKQQEIMLTGPQLHATKLIIRTNSMPVNAVCPIMEIPTWRCCRFRRQCDRHAR